MPKDKNIGSQMSPEITAILLLTAVVLALYWPVTGFEFIAMDDNLYILDNPDIQKGISLKGISWAMTTLYTTNWHPLTWLSLMADYELYGLNAPGYHISSLVLHLLNTLLLFLLLQRVTGETWKCLAVAALFAVHPLNIESVAWIAERKNVLSTLFWILTLFVYIRYAEKPGWLRYLQTLIIFALGLMAKPMLVTLPFILLLLDYWPLRRFQETNRDFTEDFSESASGRCTLQGILKEKIPFFVLSLISASITLYAAKIGGAAKSIADFPFSMRIGNALIAYISYLEKMIWPMDMAIFYPFPTSRPVWKFAAALILLIVITVFVVLKRSRHPYLTVGWFWYLITLLPVIGIIQVGFQSMANRYSYVPMIGIFLFIAWGIPELVRERIDRRYLSFAVVSLILIFAFSTWAQLPHWRNSETVFQYALKVTEDNFIAHYGMGNSWQSLGDFRMARLHYKEALRIKPGYAEVHNNLAVILMREGRIAEADAGFRKALKYKPDLAEAHNNLGSSMTCQEKYQEAAAHFARALELKPGYPVAKKNLENLIREGKISIQEWNRRVLEG